MLPQETRPLKEKKEPQHYQNKPNEERRSLRCIDCNKPVLSLSSGRCDNCHNEELRLIKRWASLFH